MPSRKLLELLIAAFAIVASSMAPAAVVVNGALTTSDHASVDDTGSFYYDLYVVTNNTGGFRTVALDLDAAAPLAPWIGAWSTSVLPRHDWEDADDLYAAALGKSGSLIEGGVVSIGEFTLDGGASLQVAVSTMGYVSRGAKLGDYKFTVSTAEPFDLDVHQTHPDGVPEVLAHRVPEPWTLLLVGTGLLGVAWRRR